MPSVSFTARTWYTFLSRHQAMAVTSQPAGASQSMSGCNRVQSIMLYSFLNSAPIALITS
nr:MAG TPA: hypothetical protein [Caudoviricetes sp.]DAQ51806.1 MAG TPA: hypothetical protein [Caudoviricetes sp.]